MKKILSLILVLAMTFSLSTTALAADSTTSSISENEAVELARWFIANDIYENGNNGWSESTVIDSVTTDSGFYGSSYIVNLSANGKNNGCNGVQREHNKKLNNGLPILHKVPPKRDYGRYFCIMAEKGGTSHGGLTEKLSPFFHAKKQEVNAYGR